MNRAAGSTAIAAAATCPAPTAPWCRPSLIASATCENHQLDARSRHRYREWRNRLVRIAVGIHDCNDRNFQTMRFLMAMCSFLQSMMKMHPARRSWCGCRRELCRACRVSSPASRLLSSAAFPSCRLNHAVDLIEAVDTRLDRRPVGEHSPSQRELTKYWSQDSALL